jgi:putative transposase
MDAEWCTEVLNEAIEMHGKPEIFNTDQGSQFTSLYFTGALKSQNILISMDGKGRAIDNVFIERLWRSVKYEYAYLNPANGAWIGQIHQFLQSRKTTSYARLQNTKRNIF